MAAAAVDWDDLRFFLAVDRAGSLAAAARGLAVDKATVSRRLASLEASLAVRLFDRKPDGLSLTPDGLRVRERVARVGAEIAALASELAGGDARGTVHLTVPQWFACRVLAPALPAFRREHPSIDLTLNASSRVLNLAQREAEVALRNAKPAHLSASARRVGTLASALYAARTYLSRRGVPRTPEEIARHDLLAYEQKISYLPAFAWLAAHDARVVLRGNDALALAAAASAGVGLAVLPCFLGDTDPALTRLAVAEVATEDIWIVVPAELRRSSRVREVMALVSGVFEKHARALGGR